MDPCELRLAKGDAGGARPGRPARAAGRLRAALRCWPASTSTPPRAGSAALRAAAPLVAKIKDRALRPEYARKLAGDLGMEIEPVQRAVARRGRPGRRRAARPAQPAASDADSPQRAGRARGAEAGPAGAGAGRPDVRRGRTPTSTATRCTLAIRHGDRRGRRRVAAATGGAVWIEAVRDACADLAAKALVGELAVEPLRVDGEPDPRYVRGHSWPGCSSLAVDRPHRAT